MTDQLKPKPVEEETTSAGLSTGRDPISGRKADLLKANKVGHKRGLSVLEKHGDHLLKVGLKLIEAAPLAMGTRKARHVTH